jgi:hypothetical protein
MSEDTRELPLSVSCDAEYDDEDKTWEETTRK